MTFSSRRFWCALGLAMCLIGSMLVPSLKSRMMRAVSSRALGTEMEFDGLHYHRKSQILELTKFKATTFDSGREVRLETPRAWMRLSLTPLIDKHLHLSKVILQDSQVYLSEMPVVDTSRDASEAWTERFRRALSSVQWDILREQAQSLVMADEADADMDANMRRWLLRSKQILYHASQLARNIQGFTNPLRHSNEIRDQLRQIEELSAEQLELERKYSRISGLVDQKLQELRTSRDKDLQLFRQSSTERVAQAGQVAAEQVAARWAQFLLNEQLDFSRAAGGLLGDPEQNGLPYSLNVRGARKQQALIDCPNIKLTGTLIAPLHQTRFEAEAEYKLTQGMDYRSHRQSTVTVQYHGLTHHAEMKLTSGKLSSGWTMESSCHAPAMNMSSASSSAAASSEGELTPEMPPAQARTLCRIAGSTEAEKVEGTVKLNVAAFDELCALPCNANADLSAQPGSQSLSSDVCWVEFAYHLDRSAISLVRQTELPPEFVAAVTSVLRQRIDQQRLSSESELDQEFNRKCDAMRSRVQRAAVDGTKLLALDRAALVEVRNKLNEALERDESYEYARSLARPNTTR